MSVHHCITAFSADLLLLPNGLVLLQTSGKDLGQEEGWSSSGVHWQFA